MKQDKTKYTAPIGDDEGVYTQSFRRSLERGQRDILAGRTCSMADICKSLGLRHNNKHPASGRKQDRGL